METKYKKLVLALVMGLFFVYPLQGQEDLKNVLNEILSNNQQLKAIQKETDRMKAEAKIGIAPADPEIEYGYMWGKPTVTGNKKDFSISQNLDFPTVYANKIKLGKLKVAYADTYFFNEKQKVIVQVVSKMVELIYQNNRYKILAKRLKDVEKINSMTKRMLENGEVGLIEQDKADLQLLNLQNEFYLCKSEIDQLNAGLKALNGNKEVNIESLSYPSFLLISDKVGLMNVFMNTSGDILLAQNDISIGKQEVNLKKSEYLPDFSVAYVSESTLGQNLKGLRAGLRIPLWSKKNTVKHSKISLDQKESQFLSIQQSKEAEWNQLWMDYETKADRLGKMKSIMDRIIPNKSLLKAYELQEISLMQFITETAFFYDSQDRYLEFEKEKYLSAAEMLKVELAK